MKSKAIYLDAHATTPVDQDVLSAMLPYFTWYYGNGNHEAGWKANAAIENARFQVSNLIGARPSEITFTSGATEAVNMALLGLARANTSQRNHIITQRTEHKAVLQCIESLRQEGYRVTLLDVDDVGRINLAELKQAITNQTLVVAIMLCNNEIGTIQPMDAIGEIVKRSGAKFFCDITQGLGWYDLNLKKSNIDMAAMSAHKIYGPRGVGALYIQNAKPQLKITPLCYGGGQERGLRPGTHNLPAIVGFGKACALMHDHAKKDFETIRALRDHLEHQLLSSIKNIKLNGCPEHRHPGNLNLSIPNLPGEELKQLLPEVMFSTGSACSSASSEPSHVISSITSHEAIALGSFRLGISKYTTPQDIDTVAVGIIAAVRKRKNTLIVQHHCVNLVGNFAG
ncbi:cysteine desulfurase family protein [Algibacter mikhailovii]|uniref:cysteine desulfurase family protein n=1 Tax=Algibacter mikhailovii TaxID=425498 RepID=UPI0024944AF9|nr:cysteine desulfurase family protein [Algibacter mikhailovii]